MTGACCCECGARLGRHTASFKFETHETVCQATGAGRLLTVDAALACSMACMAKYLGQYVRDGKAP